MKIVHLATTDFGGAYKAVERINECMNQYGDDSCVLVRPDSMAQTSLR